MSIVAKLSVLAGLLAGIVMAQAAAADRESLRLAVTTSFQNSGLADVLLPEIERDLGIDVHLLVVGTGQALRLGAAGDVDAVLVHSAEAEKAFVASGHATHRREIMYNDFVIVGPRDDPAAVSSAESVTEALTRIAEAEAPFVSRGDDSGTHRRELALWEAANQPVEARQAWYRVAGAGMGATLNLAAAMNAYTLSDRGSWLSFGNKRDLDILLEGDAHLFNQYSYLPIDPAHQPHVDYDRARAIEDWLTSPTGQQMIANYTIDGHTVFTPNARPD